MKILPYTLKEVTALATGDGATFLDISMTKKEITIRDNIVAYINGGMFNYIATKPKGKLGRKETIEIFMRADTMSDNYDYDYMREMLVGFYKGPFLRESLEYMFRYRGWDFKFAFQLDDGSVVFFITQR